jgi:siroheme synthase (precorrin-2 oxidase/ferrochelatase)
MTLLKSAIQTGGTSSRKVMLIRRHGDNLFKPMPGKKIQKSRKTRHKTEARWKWRKNYRVWDANTERFLYQENWIESDLRLPAPFRVSLNDMVFIRPRGSAKGVRILVT